METIFDNLKRVNSKETDIAIGGEDFTFGPIPKFKVGRTANYGMQGYLIKGITLKDNIIYYTLSTKSGDIIATESELTS